MLRAPLVKLICLSLGVALIFFITLSPLAKLSVPYIVQDFLTLSLSVLLEATPFVVLGLVLATCVKYFISDRIFFSLMPKKPLWRRMYISTLGVFLPVCECGNVPLARGLIIKGFKPADAVTFLLSAPIINPITITTTAIAFSGDSTIVIARVIAGFVIANIIGAYFAKKKLSILTRSFQNYCEHEHAPRSKGRLRHILGDIQEESRRMMVPLVFGSMIAGLTQVLIPREVLTTLGGHVALSVVAMILLAFIVSICANVDAFFALAYSTTFTPGALVAFLVFGPMIDIKMLSLMRTTFTKRALVEMTLLVGILSYITGMVVNYAF